MKKNPITHLVNELLQQPREPTYYIENFRILNFARWDLIKTYLCAAPQKKKKSTSLMQTITRKSNPNAKTARRRDENGFDAIPLIDDTDEEDYDTV